MRLLIVAFACLGFLASCETSPPPPVFADIRFTGLPPIALDVASIEVRAEFQPQFRPPDVEHLFPVSPERAVETWARDRLRAVGQQGTARFTVLDASVVETELPRTGGVRGEFTTQATERYDASLAGRLEILDARGFPVRTANVKVARTQSVLEGTTPNQRDQIWYDMTRALTTDFNEQMEAQIRGNFGYYVQ